MVFGLNRANEIVGSKLTIYLQELAEKDWEEQFCGQEKVVTRIYRESKSALSFPAVCHAGRVELEKEHIGYWFRVEFETDQAAKIEESVNNTASSMDSVECEAQFEYNEEFNVFVMHNKENGSEGTGNRSSLFKAQISKSNPQKGSTICSQEETKQDTTQTISYFCDRVLQSINFGPNSAQLKEFYNEYIAKVSSCFLWGNRQN